MVYLKQISGPYRLHRSILSSQTVYTLVVKEVVVGKVVVVFVVGTLSVVVVEVLVTES